MQSQKACPKFKPIEVLEEDEFIAQDKIMCVKFSIVQICIFVVMSLYAHAEMIIITTTKKLNPASKN